MQSYRNKVYPNLPGFPAHMSIAVENVEKKILGYVKAVHRDKDGNIIWENAAALINQGEEAMMKGWFQGVANYLPTNFKLNLAQDAAGSIAETATTYTVVTGTGYAEVAIAHNDADWTAIIDSGDWQVTSKNCVFTATAADWDTANVIVLEAVLNAVDVLIAYADLSVARTVGNGESLTTSIILKLA